ncbi:SGNH hydrolase-like domain-containing protein, acetyltransferase AlgX [Butyrivibrio hungatei DSM 14810]|uniref:SGNH hydrolase-like domain-containing protein, acetyltransferase AlgX n=1 Tax=Butyrivibrio hungatei DSM 14810 TaxID=1121132 RepID=A0A1M7T558_9FIRM|nr:hypothetical protein [Butyrivibrio hungatei]SHN65826.1 SGNH hydrolase-like domain-containing protein, acetyltransferase AlgX [Butyrivibrio hungatei DSM 14810]
MAKKILQNPFIIALCVIILIPGFLSCGQLISYYTGETTYSNNLDAELGSKLETDIATTFWKKDKFVDFNGAFRNILDQPEMNGVVKLNNGYLLTTIDEIDDEKMQYRINNIAVLNEYLNNRGISFLFASAPYTSSKFDTELPVGYNDFGNKNADKLLEGLESFGVETLDFRQQMHDDGIDQYSMMYKTDHHWTTEAGLYAYSVLEKWIQSKTGCTVDERIADISNYEIDNYTEWHLGSRGQRTGRYYAGVDDFDVLVPKFDTLIENDEGTIGKMQELAYNWEPLAKRDPKLEYVYDKVLKQSAGHYTNLDCKNEVKVLLVSDSFSWTVCPFMMMGFKELRFAYSQPLNEQLTPELIEEYDPDVVIMLYYPQVYEVDLAFDLARFQED